MRKRVSNVKRDQRMFSNTARRIKSINTGAIQHRGGIRL